MPVSGEIAGRVALVTGSSSGIGRGIAEVLAREGADVIINYRSNAKGAETTCQKVKGLGRRALVVQADISQAADVDRLVDTAVSAFGQVDVLVNNAGITTKRSFLQTDEAFFDTMVDTDLKGAYLCAKRVADGMVDRKWGRIVNISSIHDKLTSHEFSIYAAAKGALRSLTQGLAVDLAEHGITVNAIAPGWVPVENEGRIPDNLFAAFCKDVPLGHPGTPLDIGELASFLCSERASWLTGQVIYVDGGVSCMLHMPSRVRDWQLYSGR